MTLCKHRKKCKNSLKITTDSNIKHAPVFFIGGGGTGDRPPLPGIEATLEYRGHIRWASLKVITQLISLGSSHLGAQTPAI